MFTISNEILIVDLNSQGAEILKIYNKKTQLDYLWNGDPTYWPKTSPVLFPIIGGLKEATYHHKGKSYQMGRHGFGRESMYEVTTQTESSITFTLIANEATLKVYPFQFKLSVKHELSDNKLSVTYIVENTGDENLLFSVGAHPAFKVPLVEGTSFDDYYLLFNKTENAGKWPLSKDGLIEKDSIPFLTNTHKLPLSKELFYNDALVFKHLASNSISIVSDKTKHGLKTVFDDFPYMGIWNFKDANFVCIEPWCGIADIVDTTQELAEKEGINSLTPGKCFSRKWSVEVF